MSLTILNMTAENQPALHDLMLDYYRAADSESGDMVLDAYVETLLDLVNAQVLDCRLADQDGAALGFAIFTKDRKGTDFTEMPGYGTIMELYVLPEYQRRGIGTQLAQEAEKLLREQDVKGFYICAYEAANGFWEKLGYKDSGEVGTNEQALWIKA